MKEKRNCKIVQDLLPNYIEKLTNEETNKFVEEHLNECTDCKEILENMKKDVDLNAPKRNEKEVKYIKKFNRKFKILRNILLVVLAFVLIFVGNTFRKYIIIKDLAKKTEKTAQSTNYHIKATKIEGGMTGTYETYVKDGNIVYIIELQGAKGTQKLLGYKNKDNEKWHVFTETPEGKIASLKCDMVSGGVELNKGLLEYMVSTELGKFIVCSRLKVKKSRTNYNGSECYIIDNSSLEEEFERKSQEYIDKDTGLRIKVSNGSYVVTYQYEFDNVDDSVFIEPDISEYELQ